MKKVKKLLLTAVAALSLSACSFEDVKGYATTAGEKIVEVWNSLLEKIGIKKKEEKGSETPCEHKDENNDFKCDLCGAELAIKSVALDTKEAKLAFARDEEFDSRGVKVIATSEVGSKKELEFTTSTPDMSTTGTKTVTVSAKAGSETKTFEYSISVTYWSEMDLAVFEAASLTEYAPLPYLPSHNMRVEYELDEDGYLDTWKIVADNISEDDYVEYYSKLLSYNVVVEFSEDEVTTFELQETAVQAEGYDGLSEVSVYVLVPHYYDAEHKEESRSFTVDEYFVVGMNEDSQLVIESVLVNASLDGYFFGNEFANGKYAYPAEFVEYFADPVGNYFSEVAYSSFPLPVADTSVEEAQFVPINLKSMYPLNFADYDLVWRGVVTDQTQEVYDAYLAEFDSLGYEKQTVGEGEEAYDVYTLENKFVGHMEFEPSFEQGLIFIDFYYVAPEGYVSHLAPIVESICVGLGANADEVEIDDSYYRYFGVSCGFFDATLGEGQTSEDLIINYGRSLVKAGFIVTEEIYHTEGDEESDGYYEITLGNDSFSITIYVDETPVEGAVGVEVDMSELSEGQAGPTLSKAEAEAQRIHAAAYGYKGLKGVDYLVTEDEEGEVVTAQVALGDTPTDLENACALVAESLGDSYVLASGEAGEGTFTQVYHDEERGFIVTLVATSTEGSYSVSLSVRAHAFITPEKVMIEFLTTHTGAAPASTDYSVNSEDQSCLATLAIAAESASAEEFQAVAESLAAELGESFTVTDSQGDETSYTVSLFNEVSGLDAFVIVTLGEESGYSAQVYVRFHVEPATGMSPEEALTDFAKYFSGSVSEVQEGVFATGATFPATKYTVDDMKGYVSDLFVPAEFELKQDWEADEQSGGEVCIYVNAVNTVLEIYVYSDTVYVKDGAIVEEGTEGAVATEVTCLEVYAYTSA